MMVSNRFNIINHAIFVQSFVIMKYFCRCLQNMELLVNVTSCKAFGIDRGHIYRPKYCLSQ